MLSERVSELADMSPRLNSTSSVPQGLSLSSVPHKPFHRPGFPVEYHSVPSPPVDRQSYPTSPSSPCSTASEHDSSLEKHMATDSEHSDDGDRDAYSKMDYYRSPNNNGTYLLIFFIAKFQERSISNGFLEKNASELTTNRSLNQAIQTKQLVIRGCKTFVMLNSTEHEISTTPKN